jgi:hypothetical protein
MEGCHKINELLSQPTKNRAYALSKEWIDGFRAYQTNVFNIIDAIKTYNEENAVSPETEGVRAKDLVGKYQALMALQPGPV